MQITGWHFTASIQHVSCHFKASCIVYIYIYFGQLHPKRGKYTIRALIFCKSFGSSAVITIDCLFQAEFMLGPICESHLSEEHSQESLK